MNLDINNIVSSLKSTNLRKIVLFGSYAYGTPNQTSDIDLLVVVDTDKNFHQRIQELRPLLPKDRPIDLIVLTPDEYQKAKGNNSLVDEIDIKGKVIYGQS
ncbi:nucleotidyltransferase domain-containing protein [Candidatus Daviesbacteria bacterium]|nr:nucleotidyltransferase domain-containing protein [Candidatus Daviesbacteria bacterium]